MSQNSENIQDNNEIESQDLDLPTRRLFLQGVGKWSGAAIMAALVGFSTTTEASAGGWINRRGGGGWINGGGGWLNGRGGGGGGWINRRGGGSWINRR